MTYNTGDIYSYVSAGGLIGNNYDTVNIENSYNVGDIIVEDGFGGGFVGKAYGDVIILNSLNIGNITSFNPYTGTKVGGFIGSVYNAYIYNSINFGNVSAYADDATLGAIIGGQAVQKDIVNTYYTGIVLIQNIEVLGIQEGILITDITSLDESFFINNLNWSSDIWSFTNINITNGVYPNLISFQ